MEEKSTISIKNKKIQIIDLAKNTFKVESSEILKLSELINKNFEHAINSILNCTGKIIVSGMGKSGHIGKKIAATLSSTGTPSFFLHPAEAYHGDLGMIEKNDIVLLLSYSGETDEVLKIIPFLKLQKNIIISITGNPQSTLAKNSNYHLNVHIEKEACPLNLAPMSSTTATLVMGDAIATVLMQVKNFKNSDFAKFHPGGSLGRRLLTRVKDIMHTQNLPICLLSDNIKDIVKTISSSRFGLCVVMEKSNIIGIITDGDIRRAMDDEVNFFQFSANDLLTKNPKTISLDAKLTEAQKLMTQAKINSLLVLEKNKLVGIIQIYDLGL